MMREKTYDYPFTAIVGQEPMKEAILINLVNPSAGGVLIRGQKGTAKTTAVRAIPGLMKDCRVVEIPANATEDRVAGTIDIEAALKDGEKQFQPGLLKEADGNILYVDEINLLDDHIVDLLLDAAATGRNTVEREGISCTHSARFVLIGSMNPEGNLRPQLLDRFGMVVDVEAETDVDKRVQIIENRMAYEKNPGYFCRKYKESQEELSERIRSAREFLPTVRVPKELLRLAAQICVAYGTDGHRADIGMIRTAQTIAALEGRKKASREDLERAARYVLPHRMRKNPLEDGQMDRQEHQELMSLLFYTESDLQKNRRAYHRFAGQLSVIYHFFYAENGGEQYAENWIEKFIKTKDDTQKDGAAKDKVPQKATINERMEQQKKEEEEMQQIMDLYREWFQKNEITEEEVQEWKRGVSNRKETME